MFPVQLAGRWIDTDSQSIDLVGVNQHSVSVQLDARCAEPNAEHDEVVVAAMLEGVRRFEPPAAPSGHNALALVLANGDDLAAGPSRTPNVYGEDRVQILLCLFLLNCLLFHPPW